VDNNVDTVYVFVNSEGKYGNPVGIVMDLEKNIPPARRLNISQSTGYSETVFINNTENADISIYNPQKEIPFAGHAMVGVSWYFRNKLGKNIKGIHCQKATINVTRNKYYWITAPISIMPPWNLVELQTAAEVEKYSLDHARKLDHTVIWSWLDKTQGIVRARTFATDWGIPEDEANGSGSILIASQLDRSLEIIHGKGSEIHVNPKSDDYVMLGGLCSML
jgi:predicted PhzF superfamily epimerase YddE/YHI9